MESIRQYIVDAFTGEGYLGNPAAVCLLSEWLSEEQMTSIAARNGLSETAFIVRDGGRYGLRWFTPKKEIDLCGHATLASAFVISTIIEPSAAGVEFLTQSGTLRATAEGGVYSIDLPAFTLRRVGVTPQMERAIGVRPVEAWMGRDLLCVLPTEDDVRNARPDMDEIGRLDGAMLHMTAKGTGNFNCVSRTFAPKFGVDEDPVCGSGHCHIAPYWCGKTGRAELLALQASPRGGVLHCRLHGGRVSLGGRCALRSQEEIAFKCIAQDEHKMERTGLHARLRLCSPLRRGCAAAFRRKRGRQRG